MAVSDYISSIREKIGSELLLVPVVAAIVRNANGHVLLQRRSDNNQWGIPGGIIDPEEAPAQAVVREIMEETGLLVRPSKLVGVYGGIDARTIYPNGHQVEPTIIIFECETIGGELRCADGESLELRYFPEETITQISGFKDVDFLGLTTSEFQWNKAWLDVHKSRRT